MHAKLFRPHHYFSNPIGSIISILLLSLFIPRNDAKNDSKLYKACSNMPTSPCGKPIKGKLDYPFWVEQDIPRSDCGLTEFKLSCEETNLVVDMGSNDKYRVLGIDPKAGVLSLNNYNDILETICESSTSQVEGTKLNEMLYNYSPSTEFLDLFYHCGNDDIITTGIKSNITCGDDEIYQVYFFRKDSPTPYEREKPTSCSSTKLPVSKKLFEEFTSNKIQPQVVLEGGFEVQYNNKVDLKICEECYEAGGLCWRDTYVAINDKCLYPRSGNKNNRKLIIGIIAGGVVGILLLLLVLFVLFIRRKKAKQGSYAVSRNVSSYSFSMSDSEKGSGTHMGVPTFSYNELEKATNNFDSNNELGDGGFGTVYKGKLQDGREVAVKRLYENSMKRVEQFMNEIEILTLLRHPNLVVLYGSTSQQCRKLLLVYEYIPNGTIADHLYGEDAERGNLTWKIRMNIAIETASALSYLHASDVIHRDVKTTNILLDNNFHVKVADFGLSRLFPLHVTHVSTAPQGTPGYVDPEYHQCYQLTSKSDVYSFGVVLIELISSKPAVDITRHRHEINLANLAINKIQGNLLHELVDPSLGFESDYEVRKMITDVAELAFRCLQNERELRPSMDEVLKSLKETESRKYGEKNESEHNLFRDDASLLKNYAQNLSPDSVTVKWVSRSTNSSSST